jgi:hypothetical protein
MASERGSAKCTTGRKYTWCIATPTEYEDCGHAEQGDWARHCGGVTRQWIRGDICENSEVAGSTSNCTESWIACSVMSGQPVGFDLGVVSPRSWREAHAQKVQHREKMAEVQALPQIAATRSVSSRPSKHAPSPTFGTSGLPFGSVSRPSPALHSHISGWAVRTMRCSTFKTPTMRLCYQGDKMAYAESYAS